MQRDLLLNYIRDNKNKVENNSEKYAYIILCICGAILVRFSKILYEYGYFNFM